jgi:hypothetical protein
MCKVLIPFTDPEGAEHAIRQLLREESPDALEVELLAIAEAPELHRLRRFVSQHGAEEAARAAAGCWMARVAPMLQAAGVPYQTRIVVGHAPAEIEAALHRGDVDRVLLPALTPRWKEGRPSVTVVA